MQVVYFSFVDVNTIVPRKTTSASEEKIVLVHIYLRGMVFHMIDVFKDQRYSQLLTHTESHSKHT